MIVVALPSRWRAARLVAEIDGHLVRGPELEERRARPAGVLGEVGAGERLVRRDDGLAGVVVAGHDAPDAEVCEVAVHVFSIPQLR